MHRQPKILVVEDEAPIAELISVNLRYNGYHVTWVADGAAAQREIDAQLPDLILLDWMLQATTALPLPSAGAQTPVPNRFPSSC